MQTHASPAASVLPSAMPTLPRTLQGRAIWTNADEPHGLLLGPPHASCTVPGEGAPTSAAPTSVTVLHTVWSLQVFITIGLTEFELLSAWLHKSLSADCVTASWKSSEGGAEQGGRTAGMRGVARGARLHRLCRLLSVQIEILHI